MQLCHENATESTQISTPDTLGTYEGEKRCSVPDYMFRSPGTVSNSGAKENEEDDEAKVLVVVVIVLSAMLLLSGGFFIWLKYNRKALVYDPLPTGKRKTRTGMFPARKKH